MKDQLSKTIKLGVIVLALDLLWELGVRFPRIIRAAAKALGVSRKSGYKASRRLRKLLSEPREKAAEEGRRREVVSLRIQNQILAYERDHPGVRFTSSHQHLPREAKSLCVRLLREYHSTLAMGHLAALIGVPARSLRRWDKEAQREGSPQPDLRGQHRRARPEDVARVIEEYKRLESRLTLEEFTRRYNEKYPQRTLDRRTITRILQRERLRPVETRETEPSYHPPFKVYFPGAQVSLDATEIQVFFKSTPEVKVAIATEVAIDIATGAVLGEAIEKEENAQGVERVIVKAREECAGILAVLSDNGSANRAEGIQRLVAQDGAAQIFSFPYHPQTNGHLEGFFGQFSRIAGRIEVDDTSRETLAASLAAIICRVFFHFHNHSPRERLGGLSPLAYLRSYCPRPEEVDTAQKGLEKQRQRSQDLREDHARLRDPAFRALVSRVLERHRFQVPLDEALKALLGYDQEVIEGAGQAFSVQSEREGFDERKRTFAYFVGIARNKQKTLDADRLRSEIERQKTARAQAQDSARRILIRKETAEEERLLRVDPEQIILLEIDLLLRGQLRFLKDRSMDKLRRGLKALKHLGHATAGTRDRLAATVLSWGDFGEDLKERALKLFFAEFDALAG